MRFAVVPALFAFALATENTVYSTEKVTVTACAASVTDCPAHSTTTSHVVWTSVATTTKHTGPAATGTTTTKPTNNSTTSLPTGTAAAEDWTASYTGSGGPMNTGMPNPNGGGGTGECGTPQVIQHVWYETVMPSCSQSMAAATTPTPTITPTTLPTLVPSGGGLPTQRNGSTPTSRYPPPFTTVPTAAATALSLSGPLFAAAGFAAAVLG